MKPKTGVYMAVTLLFLAMFAMADSGRGLKPRTKASQYPAFRDQKNLTLAAAQLSAKQIKNSFATELNGRYIVVEVGIYPVQNSTVELSPEQFALRVAGTNEMIRAAAPETIAAVLQKKSASTREVTLYPSGSVGYESGGRDIYGNRLPGGMVTQVGVGVGVGSNRQASTDADRKTMETELREKSLPAGRTNTAVAGYLYFPITTGKKVSYKLEYSSGDQTTKIELPKPAE